MKIDHILDLYYCKRRWTDANYLLYLKLKFLGFARESRERGLWDCESLGFTRGDNWEGLMNDDSTRGGQVMKKR
ncbi:MAG: hypothetical protein KKG93_06345 [Bacteroidetes bacterium]|nr:hypothetical protein [Bacteroidota bacterium]